MRRGEEVLQMKKMRRGRYLHKYAFVEIVTKVGCSHDLGKHLMVLSLLQDRENSARSKRAEVGGPCRSEETSCCLSRIAVNLTDLGWDFVVFPSVIQYTFCKGHCNPATLPAKLFIPEIAQIRYVSCQVQSYYQANQYSSCRSFTNVAPTHYPPRAAPHVTWIPSP